jgi:hypothetical protein
MVVWFAIGASVPLGGLPIASAIHRAGDLMGGVRVL